MGYYSTLENWNLNKPEVKIPVKELNKLIKEKFEGTNFDDVVFEEDIKNNKIIAGVEKDELTSKYNGDEEKFAKFLSKYLEKGHIEYAFTGEEGEQWGFVVLPEIYLTFRGLDSDENPLSLIESKEKLKEIQKHKTAKKFIEEKLKKYEQNLKNALNRTRKTLLKLAGYEYEIRIPAEETRRVQYDLISYFKNYPEEKINTLKDMGEEESFEEIEQIVSIDDTEDVEVLDAYNPLIIIKDATVEKI